jgi:RNA polymerase sigma-70 factor (ECF subfamily)
MLYEIHSEALVRALLHWTRGNRAVAEELTQETMIRAWQNLDKLHRDPFSLRPWLMTVARRIAIDMLRSQGARPPEVPVARFEWSQEAPEQYTRVHDRAVIRSAVRRLPREQQEVLACVYIHGHTVPQAARILGVPEGTVKSRLHYALRAARASIDADA